MKTLRLKALKESKWTFGFRLFLLHPFSYCIDTNGNQKLPLFNLCVSGHFGQCCKSVDFCYFFNQYDTLICQDLVGLVKKKSPYHNDCRAL